MEVLERPTLEALSPEEIADILSLGHTPPKVEETIPERKGNEELYDFIVHYLDMIFPGQWDISKASSSVLKIVIRFPEITIRNSKRQSHTITDLFVSMRVFCEEGNLADNISGSRGSYTLDEHRCRYTHSHISGSDGISIVPKFTTFCLGNSEMGASEAILRSQSIMKDPIAFECHLATIDAFVRWESIEGTPYKYINQIKDGNRNNTFTPPLNLTMPKAEVLKKLEVEMRKQNILLTFNIPSNRLDIPALYSTLSRLDCNKISEELKESLLLFRLSDGNYISYSEYKSMRIVEKDNPDKTKTLVREFPSHFLFQGNKWVIKEYKDKSVSELPAGKLQFHPYLGDNLFSYSQAEWELLQNFKYF